MNIILIHIGNKKIDYIVNTFYQLLKYKNKNIFFLANKKIINQLKLYKICKKIKFYNLDKVEISKNHKVFLKKK